MANVDKCLAPPVPRVSRTNARLPVFSMRGHSVKLARQTSHSAVLDMNYRHPTRQCVQAPPTTPPKVPPTTSAVTLMRLRTSTLLVLLTLVAAVQSRAHECEWKLENAGVTAGDREQVRTNCHVRTLNRALLTEGSGNNSLSALAHSTHVTVLTLHCARQVVFESEVTAGMFSVFPRLEELQILGCKVTELPPHALAGLQHLRRFTLRAHHQDWPGAALAIHSNAMFDLSRLEALDLAYNALWSFPPTMLCHLPSLITLNLTHNRLHHLPDLGLGARQPPGKESHLPPECSLPLEHLDLSHNQVTEMTERTFGSAKDLQTLSLKHNRLAHLSDWAFDGLRHLKRLDLSHNRLVAVPRSALTDLRQLRDLNLANNSLSVLPPAAFSSLGQLLTLDLSHNQLRLEPSVGLFTGLTHLVVLDVSHNLLVHLNPDTLKDLHSLQVLRVSHNQLSHLSDANFASLAKLHTLDVMHNQLTMLSSRALLGLVVLNRLSLDHNQLESVHKDAFDNCTSLHHLSLAHNELLIVPEAVTQAPHLRTLDVSHNQISSLHDNALQGLVHLQELRLAHNVLSNVSRASMVEISSLRYLDLSHNALTDIEYGALEATPKLMGLSLHHNYLGDISGLVFFLQNLNWLNVSHNSISWFDYALIPKNLDWIDMSHNQISKLENYYEERKTIGLKMLYAAHNNISDISATVVPDGIEELHLQHNAISVVAPNTFLDKTNISLIDLRHNILTILLDAALRMSPRHTPPPLLMLSNNPLQCDCAADWLLRAAGVGLRSYVGGGSILPHLGDVGAVQCRLPGLWHEAVVPLITVQPQQFLCTYQRHCFTLCHCCDFDACDCEQTCPTNCTCYHDHTWTHNVVDCGGGWSRMPSGVPMDVTEAFMDGNTMGPLTSHALIGRKNLRVLHLNHSEITAIQNRTFNGLKNLQVLRLDHNQLEALHGYEFVDLRDLRELYLQNNYLKHLSNISFSPLRAIELLRLDNNFLTTFPVWNLALNPFLLEVSLYHNSWSCECSYLTNLKTWLEANRIKATNASLIRCQHNITGNVGPPVLSDTPVRCDHYVATTRINSLIIHDYVMLLLITAALLLLLLAAAIMVLVNHRRLRLWAVCHYDKRLCEKSSAYLEDREKLFDAFVTHSAKDSAWVCGLMAPELEASGYRLCVVHRDCVAPTAPVSSQAIAESVSCSRRAVVVVSRGLVDAEWCRYDFKSAHVDALRGLRRKNILVVMLEDVPRSELDPELAAITRTAGTTLHPRDPRFWEKLRRAMPSVRSRLRSRFFSDFGAKGVSRPLVTAEHQNRVSWPLPETKASGNTPTKSLIINPYWETSMGKNLSEGKWATIGGPDFKVPLWLHNMTNPPLLVHSNEAKETESSPGNSCSTLDHSYMSVSECWEVRASLLPANTLSTLAEPNSLTSDSSSLDCKKGEQQENATRPSVLPISHRDASGYLSQSWILHPTSPGKQLPPPGQTYFV
ncbi:toll-like receptor 6 [Panulirus ornatus]|uniref:toll-like receptor 6 n=1 Tax=Panulirus ornatus TaxID=150431 RepID=UPI003A838AB6